MQPKDKYSNSKGPRLSIKDTFEKSLLCFNNTVLKEFKYLTSRNILIWT